MTNEEILGKLKEIIFCVGYAEEDVTMGAELCDGLGMDDLDIVEMAMAIEERFLGGDSIDDEVAFSWETVDDVVNYLASRPEIARAKA